MIRLFLKPSSRPSGPIISCARARHHPQELVELLDREWLQKVIDVHGNAFFGWARPTGRLTCRRQLDLIKGTSEQ
jgi:hypothetical protein